MHLLSSTLPWSRDSDTWLHSRHTNDARDQPHTKVVAGLPPRAVRTAARQEFRDATFGIFIHWGVYSLLGQGEWVMQNQSIRVPTYEWLASTFNPIKFDAHAWVSLARAAGAKYITITSRHHDGFSMFATQATRYNIVDWTPATGTGISIS